MCDVACRIIWIIIYNSFLFFVTNNDGSSGKFSVSQIKYYLLNLSKLLESFTPNDITVNLKGTFLILFLFFLMVFFLYGNKIASSSIVTFIVNIFKDPKQ